MSTAILNCHLRFDTQAMKCKGEKVVSETVMGNKAGGKYRALVTFRCLSCCCSVGLLNPDLLKISVVWSIYLCFLGWIWMPPLLILGFLIYCMQLDFSVLYSFRMTDKLIIKNLFGHNVLSPCFVCVCSFAVWPREFGLYQYRAIQGLAGDPWFWAWSPQTWSPIGSCRWQRWWKNLLPGLCQPGKMF